jgi:hypothetical protein
MKRASLALSTAAVLIASAAAFSTQDQWEEQVRAQLRRAASSYEEQGYTMTHRIYTGSLRDGGSTTVTLSLQTGKQYQIIGACDNDCTDLDLVLFDGRGNQIDIDVLDDDIPIVETGVSRSGEFRVEVRMANCTANPCRFGVGAFGR